MATPSIEISVVVSTYNRRDILRSTLQSLFEQSFPASRYEIIVVVDGSNDGTAEMLREMRPPCSLHIIEQENRGPAGARNAGFRAANSGLILFLDDDMRCDNELVATHVNAHRKLGPTVVFGAIFLAPDSEKNLASECFHLELGAFHLRHQRDPRVQWQLTECVFSNASLLRQMLVQVGGFDEEFRKREDLELGIRLAESGLRMEYIRDAIAYQHYDKTAVDLLLDAKEFGIADAMLAHKHPTKIVDGHNVETEKGWKSMLRNWAAQQPLLEKCLLVPFCKLGETLFACPPLRSIGVRALRIRRRIHWLRGRSFSIAADVKWIGAELSPPRN